MPIISTINLYEQSEQHVLSMKSTIHFDSYPKTAEQAYRKIKEFAEQKGIVFSGSPFVCFHNADLENLDVEMGFPTANSVVGNGEILGHTLPAQKVVSGVFLGAYEDTDPLMMDILQWIKDHGYEQQGEIYNYYLNDENRPASELLTQIVVPIKNI